METNGHSYVIHYFHLKGLSPTNIKAQLDSTPGESTIFTTIKYWVAEFKRDRTNCQGKHRIGRPKKTLCKYNKNRKYVSLTQLRHLAVNACLAPICSMHGLAVTTVEGIGSTKSRLHPVQERIVKAHGSQCGFCTPGIVMSMYTLLRNLPKPSMQDLETAFQGNLCRCTGYRPIIEGYKTFTENWEIMQNGNTMNGNGCAMGDKCCKLQNGKESESDEELFIKTNFAPLDPTQEPIFPPELKLSDKYEKDMLFFKGKNVVWYRPTKLEELLELKAKYPEAKIIVGNTEVGVEVKFKHFIYPVLISPVEIPEMVQIEILEKGIKIGASVSLLAMEEALREQINALPEHKTRIFSQIVDMLHWFAGKQIRSVGTIGGNIMTGSPISDMNPILLALQVEFELMSKAGLRRVKMDDNFFTGYRKNIVRQDEILMSLTIPYTTENQYFYAYKQARRRDDDIAIVNSAIYVTFKPKTFIVEDVNLAFGGMAPITITVPKTRKFLIGKPWTTDTLEESYKYLIEDLPLSPSAPGGMIQYRKALPLSFFFRAFLTISEKLKTDFNQIQINPKDLSAINGFHTAIPKSTQFFQIVPNSQSANDPVGRPLVHASAYKQATGEAIYCDDIPRFVGELYMAIVMSTKAHANIISIDPSEALKMEGVQGFFCAKDIDEYNNLVGPVFHDDEVFARNKVNCLGQTVGIVIAHDQITAQRAARKVKVEYEELQPVIVTIEDAIKHESFFEMTKMIDNGDVDKIFKEAPHILEGDCRMGGQEHFYLETQTVLAVPKEEDEMEIFCSTQHPSEINALTAHVLGIPQNRVVTRVKRLGGGFGGKESKSAIVALPAVFAAKKLKRPIRCMLDRDEDMLLCGGRHPFYIKYKTAFDDTGKILACDVHIYNNAGHTYDLSLAVVERAIMHFENSYCIPNARVRGFLCKTNLPSNTAFRGFGGPQGMFAAENMIRDIADYLNKDYVELARLNLYKEGDITHYNQKLEYCTLQRCWEECMESSKFNERREAVREFNKENRWKKRGISVVPTKFGIAFTIPFLNQAGALIHVYTDGSVLLSHGGTEMGQGLHTKMIQVASRVLEIPASKIYINETATDKVPNTSPTAASAASDLNGMAVLNACETIRDRLAPIKKQNPNGTWESWVKEAYLNRISLSSTGYYKTPDLSYNWETNTGMAFNYFTYGVAVSEVEIDCLTGDHQVLRVDIVMDLGESLNPAIDIGQVEGGFIQGYGLFVLEEMVYSPSGVLFTRGPGAYKLPGFADIPQVFNVALLKGAPNQRAVYSSKAVGEPPLFLGSSIFFAIKDAIQAARDDAGIKTKFRLTSPATSAKIRMACEDHITEKLDTPEEGTFMPWNVMA